MIVKLIRTAAEFFQLRDEWNALLESSSSNCVFLTHEWLSMWWKHLSEGRKLSILTARDGGKLIGILPLAICPPRYARMMPHVAEFIGSGVIGSDYLDAIIQRGRECDVLRAFVDEIRRWGLMMQLSQLRRQSCVVAALPQFLGQDQWRALETGMNVCPFIDLTNHTWETYLIRLAPSSAANRGVPQPRRRTYLP